MRWPLILSVSPSVTVAGPEMSARVGVANKESREQDSEEQAHGVFG